MALTTSGGSGVIAGTGIKPSEGLYARCSLLSNSTHKFPSCWFTLFVDDATIQIVGRMWGRPHKNTGRTIGPMYSSIVQLVPNVFQ